MNTILTSITNWKIKKEEKNLLSYIIYTVSNQNPTKDNLSLISFSPSLGTENSNFHIISMQFSFFIIFLVLNRPHRTQPKLNTTPPHPSFLIQCCTHQTYTASRSFQNYNSICPSIAGD